MIKYLKNTSGGVLRLPALKRKFPVDYVWQIPYTEIDVVMTSLDTLTAIRSGDLQVGWSETEFYSDPHEGEAFLLDTFIGVNTVIDSTNITEYIPEVVEDSETGKKMTSLYFQILRMLRELYNESTNPLYKPGFQTILEILTNIQTDITTIQNDVSVNTSNISDIQGEIDSLASDTTSIISVMLDEIDNLQDDMDLLASDTTSSLSAIYDTVSQNSSDISDMQTSVSVNTSNISINAISIDTLQDQVADITDSIIDTSSSIEALQTITSDNSSNISSLQSSVTTNTTNISTNSTAISDIQNDLDSIQNPKLHLERPHDLLIYYGWLNSYNSDVNGWSNEMVAQDMARYNILVFGDGIQDSGHGDYANSQVIIPRIKELNPNALIFGYVTVNQTLSTFQTKADGWETLQVDGIFLDEAGYDYGTITTNSRDAFNTRVNYVHGLTYAKLCFANAWNMDHVIGTENDTSYPNTTWNSSEVESNLNENDWFLLESFAVNTLSYSNGYETATDWFARGNKAVAHRDFYDINLASVAVIDNTDTDALDFFNFAFTAGLMYSLDAVGTSDIYYGASTAKVVMWTRPDISGMGRVWERKPNVVEDLTDADAYIRFTDFGKLSVDFTNNNQESEIVKN